MKRFLAAGTEAVIETAVDPALQFFIPPLFYSPNNFVAGFMVPIYKEIRLREIKMCSRLHNQ